MPVYRVTIRPLGAHEKASVAGDFIARDPAAASGLAHLMLDHPAVVPLLVDGYTIDVDPSPTDPRFAANWDGPTPTISTGGTC